MSVFRKFVRDHRGVAAVEFALIAPAMILLYSGLVEVCQAVIAARKANHVASAIGDLVSQVEIVSSSDVSDIFGIGQTIMAPYPTTTLQMRLTSVTLNSSGTPKVDWSRGSGGLGAYSAGATVSLPATLGLVANDSVVMAEAKYQYNSILKSVMPNALNFNEAFYLRPRRSDKVTCSNC